MAFFEIALQYFTDPVYTLEYRAEMLKFAIEELDRQHFRWGGAQPGDYINYYNRGWNCFYLQIYHNEYRRVRELMLRDQSVEGPYLCDCMVCNRVQQYFPPEENRALANLQQLRPIPAPPLHSPIPPPNPPDEVPEEPGADQEIPEGPQLEEELDEPPAPPTPERLIEVARPISRVPTLPEDSPSSTEEEEQDDRPMEGRPIRWARVTRKPEHPYNIRIQFQWDDPNPLSWAPAIVTGH